MPFFSLSDNLDQLVVDVSEVIFNEVAFHRLMRHPTSAAKAPNQAGGFETEGKQAVVRPKAPAGKLPPLPPVSARSSNVGPVKFRASVLDALDNDADEVNSEVEVVRE